MSDAPNDEVPAAIRDYFALRLMGLAARIDGDGAWVDVTTRRGRTVAPGYGRGVTVKEAAERAMQRYLVEQEPPTGDGIRERWQGPQSRDIE